MPELSKYKCASFYRLRGKITYESDSVSNCKGISRKRNKKEKILVYEHLVFSIQFLAAR